MYKRQDHSRYEIKNRIKFKIIRCIEDHSLVPASCNQIYQLFSNSKTEDHCHHRPDTGIQNCQADSMAHAVHPPCPGILPAEDRHRLPKHTKHDHKHLRDLAGRCMGHDDISSQTVEGSLQRQSRCG